MQKKFLGLCFLVMSMGVGLQASESEGASIRSSRRIGDMVNSGEGNVLPSSDLDFMTDCHLWFPEENAGKMGVTIEFTIYNKEDTAESTTYTREYIFPLYGTLHILKKYQDNWIHDFAEWGNDLKAQVWAIQKKLTPITLSRPEKIIGVATAALTAETVLSVAGKSFLAHKLAATSIGANMMGGFATLGFKGYTIGGAAAWAGLPMYAVPTALFTGSIIFGKTIADMYQNGNAGFNRYRQNRKELFGWLSYMQYFAAHYVNNMKLPFFAVKRMTESVWQSATSYNHASELYGDVTEDDDSTEEEIASENE
jgi:hypothetical protein